MERSQAEQLTATLLPQLQAAMALDDWRIETRFVVAPDVHRESTSTSQIILAEIITDPERQRATIEINYSQIHSQEELEDILVHELSHILLSPYQLIRRIIHSWLDEGQRNAFDEVLMFAEESSIRYLERLFQRQRNLQAARSKAPVANSGATMYYGLMTHRPQKGKGGK